MKTGRRNFVRGMLGAGAGALMGLRLPVAMGGDYRDYSGKLLVSIQARGGWDPTCFCDPKTNTPGEPIINQWAETDEVRQAGNIPFAPFAENEMFFTRHHARMLVINGIDMQTNAHDIGTVHNWTGRSSEAFPTLSALHAAHNAPSAELACLSFGAYTRGAALLPVSAYGSEGISETRQLEAIAGPAQGGYLHEEDWVNIQRYHRKTTARLVAKENLVPATTRTRTVFESAFAGEGGLADFVVELKRIGSVDPWAAAVAAFKTGVSVSVDLPYGSFDTHSNNDERQAPGLTGLATRIDDLWKSAEDHGFADRLIVVIGSEFSRTNYYNSDDGKDHWPIGSLVVMEENQPWTDRVVAGTDELHFARPVNPRTLDPDPAGDIIYPNQVHKALRRHLGLEDSLGARLYPFRGVADLPFFG